MLKMSMLILLLWPLCIGLVFIVAWLCYTFWVHPLSPIPNASLLSPISRLLWALPSECHGRITLDLPRLHEQLGHLVRTGPNEVSFYSIEIYKEVHSIRSPFSKDPRVYGQFVQDSHPALFSITRLVMHLNTPRGADSWASCSTIQKCTS